MPGFFDTVDAVFVINLDHRTDRWAAFKERWQGIIPDGKLIRSSGVVGVDLPGYGDSPWFTESTGDRGKSWAGAAGCALSHKKVIYEAQKMGFGTIVIMEDDAVPSEAMADLNYNKTLTRFIQSDRKWGILYLGFNKMPKIGMPVSQGRDKVEIWRVPGVLALHAYVVNKNAYPALLGNLPEKDWVWAWLAKYRAVDTWVREFFEGASKLPVFAVIPRLVVQAGFTSDIATHHQVSTEKIPVFDKPSKVGGISYFFYSCFQKPLSYMKNRLNATRTYRRAKKHGFPGLRRKS